MRHSVRTLPWHSTRQKAINQIALKYCMEFSHLQFSNTFQERRISNRKSTYSSTRKSRRQSDQIVPHLCQLFKFSKLIIQDRQGCEHSDMHLNIILMTILCIRLSIFVTSRDALHNFAISIKIIWLSGLSPKTFCSILTF